MMTVTRDLLAGADGDRCARSTCGADPLGHRLARTNGGQFGRIIANSSPPKRATVSIGRMQSCSACGDVLEHQVAGRVAVGVVDALEVVDVDHQHQRRLAGAGDAVDLAGQRQLELAPVGQAGQRVAARQLAQAVDHRLQPGALPALAPVGQHVARLLQQLQRTVEAERGCESWVGGSIWRGTKRGVRFGSV